MHRADIGPRNASVLATVGKSPLAKEHFVIGVHMLAARLVLIECDCAIGFGVFDFCQSTILGYNVVVAFVILAFDHFQTVNCFNAIYDQVIEL